MKVPRVSTGLLVAVIGLMVLFAAPVDLIAAGNTMDDVIDINKATLDELVSVPGIGPVTAQRIIDFREESGNFKSVDDLLKIKGIGEKLLEKIRDRLSAGRSKK